MDSDKQWLLTGQPSPEIPLFGINRKKLLASPAWSNEPAGKKLGQITCSFSFSYLCVPPSSSFHTCEKPE